MTLSYISFPGLDLKLPLVTQFQLPNGLGPTEASVWVSGAYSGSWF